MKIVYIILFISLSYCLFVFTTLTAKAQIEIYPFKISMGEINYEPNELGKKIERTVTFTNTLSETVILKTNIDHPAFKSNFTEPIKLLGKSDPIKSVVKIIYEFTPTKHEPINTKLTFTYRTESNTKEEEGKEGIPVRVLVTILKADIPVIDFGEVFIGDTVRNSLLIKNVGNKPAVFKVTARNFIIKKDFEIDSVFLKEEHKIEPLKEVRIPFKFFPNRVGPQDAECKLRIGDDNPKLGYDVLAIIRMKGTGIKRPPLVEMVTIPQKLSVSIGDEMVVPVNVNIKHLPEQAEKIIMSGKIAFRDGTLGVITADNNTGTVVNDRRVIEFEVTLSVDSELKGNIPIRFVGALGDSDTTTFSLYDCRFDIVNVPIKSNIEKVNSTVTIDGFWEVNGQKRILQSRGEGDVVIMANNPVFNSDISMKCIGLQRDADIKIYNSGGNLVYASTINVTLNPDIFIPYHTLNFGTYTAVLVYGTQYSTKRFIVVP